MECLLAHWFLDVSFHVVFVGVCSCLATALELPTALRLWVLIGLMAFWFGRFSLVGFCRFLLDFGTHGCHLACLEPLLWRPGGPWDDPGAILGRSWDIGGRKK